MLHENESKTKSIAKEKKIKKKRIDVYHVAIAKMSIGAITMRIAAGEKPSAMSCATETYE